MKDTKLQKIIFILEELHKRPTKSIDAYDKVLIDEFDNPKKRSAGSGNKPQIKL